MDFPFHFGCSLGPPAPTRDATSPCCPSCSPGVANRPGTAPLVFPHSSCYAGTPRPLGCESPSGAAAGWCGGGMWTGGGVSPKPVEGQNVNRTGEDIELKDLTWRTKDGGGEGVGTTPVAETNIQEVPEVSKVCRQEPPRLSRRETVSSVENDPEPVAMTTEQEAVQESYEHYYYDLGDTDDLEDDDSDGIDGPSCTDPIFFNPDGSIEVAFSDSETDQLQDFISLLPASPPSTPPTMSPTTGDHATSGKHTRSVSFSPIRSVARPVLIGDDGGSGGTDSPGLTFSVSSKNSHTIGISSSGSSKGFLTSRNVARGRLRSRSAPNRALPAVALPFESEPYVQRLREEGKRRAAVLFTPKDDQLAAAKAQPVRPSFSGVPHTGRLPFSPHDSHSLLTPYDKRASYSGQDNSSQCDRDRRESRLSLSTISTPSSKHRGSCSNTLPFSAQDSRSTIGAHDGRVTHSSTHPPERPKSILLPHIDGSLRGSSDSRVRFTDSTLQAAIQKSDPSSLEDPSLHHTPDSDRRHLQIRVRMLSNSSERLGNNSRETPGWLSCRHAPGEDQPLPSEWKRATGKPRPPLKGCRRSLSMEDAIVNMANHPQEKEPFRLHRTNSTDRITKHLRAKLGLPLPASPVSSEPGTSSGSTPISIPKGGLRRQCLRTRLPLLPSQHRRVTSFSSVHTVSRSVGEETSSLVPLHECCRCHLNCASDEGDFTCSGCSALQRVRNAFLLEVYSDRSPTGPPSSSCYGVRVGLGLVPLVVALVSLVVCSFVLLSETVLGSACDIFCPDDRRMSDHRTRSDGIFDWLDPNNNKPC